MSGVGRAPGFHALEGRWLHLDRYYRIFVTGRHLAGAYLAGQIYDEKSAATILAQLYPFLRGWVQKKIEARAHREALYAEIDPDGPDFLSRDFRNFRIERREVVDAELRTRRSLWTGGVRNAGLLTLRLSDGSHRRFILAPGEEDAEALHAYLEEVFPGLGVR